jgi:Arc/MetJ-type ribon-helix-helix transcriptional regulator
MTISLPESLARAVRETVASGRSPSEDALVTDAVRNEMKRLRDEEVRRDAEAAMRDPLYVADMEAVMEDFKYVDAETARMVDEDER